MVKEGGTVNNAIATFILIAGAGFPLWIFVSTKYIIKNENLEILSGPFSWNIPIKSIKSVDETQSAITSPALSFDRLEIKYNEDKVILVSPAEKNEFIKKLNSKKSINIDNNLREQTASTPTKNNNQKTKKKRGSE